MSGIHRQSASLRSRSWHAILRAAVRQDRSGCCEIASDGELIPRMTWLFLRDCVWFRHSRRNRFCHLTVYGLRVELYRTPAPTTTDRGNGIWVILKILTNGRFHLKSVWKTRRISRDMGRPGADHREPTSPSVWGSLNGHLAAPE